MGERVEANNNGVAARSIREVQQSFGESLGFGNEIIWDLLSDEQSQILETKIRTLIPDPTVPRNLVGDEREKAEERVAKQCGVFARLRQTLFNAVWEQRKYTNRQSLTSIFYVLVATDETDHNNALNCTKWSCHPVFRARRCLSDSNGRSNNSDDCCMIYVDENGRVYHNWESYVTSNQLPEGIMVTPPRGVYNLTLRGEVILQSMPTPASSTGSKVLGALDITSAVGGLGAAAVPIAGLAFTVAAPVMLVAGAVGLAAAGYSTARAGAQLVDRSQHEQSINVTDRTARGHWLSVVAGAVGLGAAGATSAVTMATNAGREVGAIAQLTVNSMNISSIMISATGLTSGVIDLILKHQDGDDISTMDVLQLSASLFLFTHSVYNFKLASTIINDTANNRIGSYRETLSNRQRRMFDKVVKETIRTKGVSRANMDIIRNVNEMPSRQQFNDLYKINRDLNRNGIRPSFAANGQGVELNGQVVTNTAELRASVQHNIGPDILGRVTNPLPESFQGSAVGGNNAGLRGNNAGRVFTGSAGMTESTAFDAPENTRNYADGVRILRLSSLVINGVAIALSQFGDDIFTRIINAESFENALLMLADNLSDNVMRFVLNLTETFMHIFWDELNDLLKFYISAESVLYRIGTHILDNYRYLTIDQLRLYTGEIIQAVNDYFTSLNPNNFPGLLTKCKVCNHFYNICDL
ncbi:uncharacterized protein LOC133841408 [Drosophila sulfurigaster albostrigata]|uniref:uncharacterized protein LOC133841408 n=1 Tax=Drosophila sulfurigaster albostrigata TaxID=89887 RepID=UPI002D21CCA1|nr:uncharacterized protein LOC133841408 [Drosophila sulfurigaster albostrigata]